MKRVVSVSLGSRSRDYTITVELLGEQITIERIGTNGNAKEAQALYEKLDGQVDCLGVGGAVLAFESPSHKHTLPGIYKLIKGVRHTPVVDGSGFKNVVERRMAQYLDQALDEPVNPRTVLITSAVDRLGLTQSFAEAGYELICGDLGFALDLPIPLKSLQAVDHVVRVVGPFLRFLPMSMLYPTGEREDINTPKFVKWFDWAHVIAGDCNYITHSMPLDMQGKIIATNTTTERDVRMFRERGVTYLLTSTPRLGTRSFGTNLMEATLVALAGKGRELGPEEVEHLLDELHWGPNLERLN